ncbi:MAG: Rieske 2Fe-2S domain-containing protein [Nostocoides sp.]
MSNSAAPMRRLEGVPHNTWYAVALSDEVGRAPIGRVALGQRVVVYRTGVGVVVALSDRCVHAPVALSEGSVDGDDIIAPYSGFRYAPNGQVIAVPTQTNVPYGAHVHAYPVHDDGSFVWIWPGEPGLAALRATPVTSCLRDPDQGTVGGQWITQASLTLMQDNFADITHLPRVDSQISPPALLTTPPPLAVQVTETSVSFSRDYPPARIAPWQATLLDLDPNATYAQREEGAFVSPGLWVDRWAITHGSGQANFTFTHALTPVDERRTMHAWRATRNFALGASGDGTVRPLLEQYYRRVKDILEGMQALIDEDGAATAQVRLSADAAGSQVRRIMARLASEEIGRA